MSYPAGMGHMRGMTIKLPEPVARELKQRARQSGRSVAALVRESIETSAADARSVYAMTSDLAGSLAGSKLPASNTRTKFRRS